MSQYDEYRAQLGRHTVTKIDYLYPRARYPRIHGKNAIKGYHGFGGTVEIAKIHTDLGAAGWASLCRKTDTARGQERLILGKKLTEIFDPETGILSDGYIAFDIALHDLAGRILNIPICQMINPDSAEYVRVYDGAIYMNDIIPEDRPFGLEFILENCRQDYEAGYRDMKIKIGRSHQWMEHDTGIKRDIQVVRAIHSAFPDVRLLVDANDGYSLEDCFSFLEGIRGIPLYWFEEPFREEEATNRKLKDYIRLHCPDTRIADGESMTDIPLLFDLAGKGLLDIWMPDVCEYGFTPWRKLLPELKKNGYLASPHAWGQKLKTHYCAHLAAAYPSNIPIIEGVLGSTEGVNDADYVLTNGAMRVPRLPGFGMELYWAPAQKE